MTPSNTASSAPCLEDLLAHGDFVRNLARSLVVDVHSADDLVQETWIVAMRNPPRHSGALQGWLSSVVRNLALRSRRSFGRRSNHEQLSYETRSAPTPADAVAEQSVAIELANAVDSLDPIYRDVVTMRYFDEVAPREIADRLAIPVETVRTRLKRATDRLRTRLDDEHGGDRSRWLGAVVGLAGLRDAPLPTGTATATGSATPVTPGTAPAVGARSALLWIGALVTLTTVAVLAVLRSFSSPTPTEVSSDLAHANVVDDRPEVSPRAPLANSTTPLEAAPDTTESSVGMLRVRGRVVGATGRAVASASIFVSEPGLPDVVQRSVVAGAGGTFELTAVDPRSWIGARAGGLRSSRLRIAWDPARGSDELRLTLPGSEQFVRGFVRDRAGQAIANATVRPVRVGRPLPLWSLDGAAELAALPAATRTDERGWFELAGLGSGRVPLVISAPALAPWSSNPVTQSDQAAPLDIVLEPEVELADVPTHTGEDAASAIRGRVVPVTAAAASVVAEVAPTHDTNAALSLIAEGYVGAPDRWATCEEDGTFELAGLDASDVIGLFVGAGPPRGAPHALTRVDEGELELGADDLAETSVTGRVSDDGGGLLEQAVVLFDYGLGTEPLRAAVDARTGRFELPAAPLGSARLFVWARGLTPRSAGSIEITAGETTSIPPLRIARNGGVRGRVAGVDELSGSRPWLLRLASDSARPFDATSQNPPAGFTFGPDGTFSIDLLPPGDYTLLARRGASSSGLVPITVRTAEVTAVELSLIEGDPVNLELHFPPMPGVAGTVVATIRSQSGRLYRQGALPWERVDSEFVPMTITLPSGSYVVTATIGPDDLELSGTFDVSAQSSASIRVVLQ